MRNGKCYISAWISATISSLALPMFARPLWIPSSDACCNSDCGFFFYFYFFPNYEALMSLYHYIEPKLSKMQYWKGETIVKESQPYKEDEL